MRKLLIACAVALLPCLALASGGVANLKSADIDLSDEASLQRGFAVFSNYCASCHSAKYMRYNRIAADLNIDDATMKGMLSGGTKLGDPIKINMDPDKAEKWFGVTPPDLSLTARLRGEDWLYTYFTSFYRDTSSASGWNNTLYENVAMPHVLSKLQGTRVLKHVQAKEGEEGSHAGPEFEMVTPGTLNAEEYEQTARDLTGFMVYMAEPIKLKRYTYGMFVMAFLFVFLILTYLLKKEYWKDVH